MRGTNHVVAIPFHPITPFPAPPGCSDLGPFLVLHHGQDRRVRRTHQNSSTNSPYSYGHCLIPRLLHISLECHQGPSLHMPPGVLADARIGLQLKFPTYGTDIPILSFISAIRIMGRTKDVLDDAYKKVSAAVVEIGTILLTYISVSDFQVSSSRLLDCGCVWKIYRGIPSSPR